MPKNAREPMMTTYEPERYAFRFPNAFINHVWSGRIPPRLGREYNITTSGRCGGMVFASLDFYHLATPVPTLNSQDFAPERVPPDGHPLADYIFARQLHSMLTTWRGVANGIRFLHLSGLTTPRLIQQSRTEEQKTRRALDRGEPVVLGLIQSTSRDVRAQGVNHQVICYGYRTNQAGQLEFSVYDPNEPYDDAVTEPYQVVFRRTEGSEDSAFGYEIIRPGRIDRWRGFFVQHYQHRSPDHRLLSV